MRLLAYFLIFGWLFFPNYFQILRPRVSPAPLTPLTPFNRVIIPRGAGWAGRGRICTYRDICQHTEHRGADQQRPASLDENFIDRLLCVVRSTKYLVQSTKSIHHQIWQTWEKWWILLKFWQIEMVRNVLSLSRLSGWSPDISLPDSARNQAMIKSAQLPPERLWWSHPNSGDLKEMKINDKSINLYPQLFNSLFVFVCICYFQWPVLSTCIR